MRKSCAGTLGPAHLASHRHFAEHPSLRLHPHLGSDSAKATMAGGTGAPRTLRPASYCDSAIGVFALLVAFRIVNALTLRTFFQPDEFFQSLEPAWQLAFGEASGACITWVNALSILHVVVGCLLTMRAGVENAVALVPASSAIRCRLSPRGLCCVLLSLDATSQSRAAAGDAQGDTSNLRGLARLLHMENRGKGLWPPQPYRARYCRYPAAILLCQFLIFDPASLACLVSMQPVAVVLLHADAVQLP
jgi:hypothetical protein